MKDGRTPFFSFLVPTRDRPELIGYALQSLKRQDFLNFEVIVSDNYTTRPCKQTFDSIADDRFHYVTPPSPLAMPDNWEFALQHARGEYIGVLIDKTVLLPSTLQTVFNTIEKDPVEIVSWWSESYYLQDEAAGYGLGTYSPGSQPNRPQRFDPAAELQRRFILDVRRGLEGKHYFRGKICFGVYHRDLVARIKSRLGRLFFPLSPDYTSMLSALALANSAIDLGRPCLMSFSSLLSTGGSASRNAEIAKNYLLQNAPGVTERLPLPGVYASHHNSIAYDYLRMQERLGGRLDNLHLNLENLALRVKEDLEQQQWNDPSEKLTQESIVASHLKAIRTDVLAKYRIAELAQEISKLRQSPAARRLLRPLAHRFPNFRNFVKTLLGEPHRSAWVHPGNFSSIIEAADAADSYYNCQLAGMASGKT